MDHVIRESTSSEHLNFETNKTVTLNRWVARWPTPSASIGGTHTGLTEATAESELAKGHQIGLGAAVAMWPTPTSSRARSEGSIKQMRALVDSGQVTEAEAEAMIAGSLRPSRMEMWPTPTASMETGESPEQWNERQRKKKAIGINLQLPLGVAIRMWPTPIVNDSKNNDSPSQNARHSYDLNVQAAQNDRWPTPTGDDANNVDRLSGDHQSLSRDVGSGQLNPRWVEWLMGLPIGWVALEPLPIEAYDEWAHGSGWWEVEPHIPRVVTGMKQRTGQLRALGNGIVPAVVAQFLRC